MYNTWNTHVNSLVINLYAGLNVHVILTLRKIFMKLQLEKGFVHIFDREETPHTEYLQTI